VSAQAVSPASVVLPVQSYTLSSDGAPQYGYNDGGNDLTDGVMDVQVYGGYYQWSPYVLWDGVSPTITFDLGVSRQVSAIEGHFLTYPNAAVYLPLSASVRFSDDGVTYGDPVLQTSGYDLSSALGNDTPVTLSLLGAPGHGRFVSLTLVTPGRWIALGEVQLMSAVPEPQAVALALAGIGVLGLIRRRRS
jgi:MYXO-CTERM domain-containing protein